MAQNHCYLKFKTVYKCKKEEGNSQKRDNSASDTQHINVLQK